MCITYIDSYNNNRNEMRGRETLGAVLGGFEAEIGGEDLGGLSLGLGKSGKVA